MDKNSNRKADVNDVFWINDFDVSSSAQGVSAKFKKYMRDHGYCSDTDYYCALNKGTPSTAITKTTFDTICKNNGHIYLGRYDANNDSWQVYELDKVKIADGFKRKSSESKDGNRLNINEEFGNSVSIQVQNPLSQP